MGSIPVEGNFFYKLAEAVLYAPPSPLSVVLIFGEGGCFIAFIFISGGRWVAVAHQAVFFVGVDCMAVVLIFWVGWNFGMRGFNWGGVT